MNPNIQSSSEWPALFEASEQADLSSFVAENSQEVEQALENDGIVLFRGFSVGDADDFDRFVKAISTARMDYVYGSTPRTAVGNKIFTATEYPANKEIPLHSEVSYHTEWPLRLALCCIVPASTGGATPVADLRKVTTTLGEEFVNTFTERKVRYVRHYHPHIDVPWQQVFRTDSKKEVARFCTANAIDFEWLDNEVLRTSQICQGTIEHPKTQEIFFFNQAHLFHISGIEADKAEAMREMFGESMLPRNAYFGDGEEIPAEAIRKIADAYESAAVDLNWQQGDVALLDNLRVAHGRRTFTGERRILAALMDPSIGERFPLPRSTQKKSWWKIW